MSGDVLLEWVFRLLDDEVSWKESLALILFKLFIGLRGELLWVGVAFSFCWASLLMAGDCRLTRRGLEDRRLRGLLDEEAFGVAGDWHRRGVERVGVKLSLCLAERWAKDGVSTGREGFIRLEALVGIVFGSRGLRGCLSRTVMKWLEGVGSTRGWQLPRS